MAFMKEQATHQALREIIAERTEKIVIWIGAGLSAEALLPTWSQLKEQIVEKMDSLAVSLEDEEKDVFRKKLTTAITKDKEIWLSFQLLKALAPTSYNDFIRDEMKNAHTVDIPDIYRIIWKLRPSAVISLNLDRLVERAYAEEIGIAPIHKFTGDKINSHMHVLNNPNPFICYLHGVIDDESSWVFTLNELNKLQKRQAYTIFINSILSTCTVIFIGISADDIAVGGHLERLKKHDISNKSHFWITDRRNLETHDWAESVGVRVIRYESENGKHDELSECLIDIINFESSDQENFPPVMMQGRMDLVDNIPEPEKLMNCEINKIRYCLNSRAKFLIEKNMLSEYEEFIKEYDEVIHRAWYTSEVPGHNNHFGYTLESEEARGAFGRVYKARGEKGEQCAIKVLLDDIRTKKDLLYCFRRGVRSMRILSQHNIDGMVEYKEASEIPAYVVMDWIDGPSLYEAVKAKSIDNWYEILRIATELVDIIRRAHRLPERVLHRDIRPQNIILEGYYTAPDEWKVKVLDFDLSWHKGAQEESIIHGSTMMGYLAPEQLRKISGVSTRHSSVDSFGLGMTLFFLISGNEPYPNQHVRPDWELTISEASNKLPQASLYCLPSRFSRLIEFATQDVQSKRWDMTKIRDELVRLYSAMINSSSLDSAEILAEEVVARTIYSNRYMWEQATGTALLELSDGLKIAIEGDESSRNIALHLNYAGSGRKDRRTVTKSIKQTGGNIVSILRKNGWKAESPSNWGQSLGLKAKCPSENVMKNIDNLSQSIERVIREFSIY
jgi:serine/threonine protein kinase